MKIITNSNIALLYEHYIVLKILFLKHTPHCTALCPFDKIKTRDYVPAIREGIRRQNAEIEAIIPQSGSPDICQHSVGLREVR